MKLISTISWSALAAFISLATGFVSVKTIAVLIGPPGVALVGQFGNFIQIVMSIVLGGVSLGLVKYTSQFKDNKVELYKIWGTTIWIVAIPAIVIMLSIMVFHNYLAIKILQNQGYGIIFIVFAMTMVLYVSNYLILNILNGLHQIKLFNLLNMLNSILSLIVTVVLVYSYNIFGALLALVTSQSLTFLVVIGFIIKSNWFKACHSRVNGNTRIRETVCFSEENSLWGKFDKYYFKKLMVFTFATQIAICFTPVSEILVRSYLVSQTSWQVAGYWQGLQKISDSYLMVVYAVLGTYFLPKLASLENRQQISMEIKNGYKVIMPFVVASAVVIFLLRDFVIRILFTSSFGTMRDMFFWQFLGDCFRIGSYFFAYLMLAKSKIGIFVVTEIIFGISYVALSYFFINIFSANGVVMAFCLCYFLYFGLFVILYKKGYLF